MTDEKAIRETIQVYFDAMFESDSSKVFEAFHENAKITGYIAEKLTEMSVTDFAAFVASQPSARAAGETPFLEEVSLTCLLYTSPSPRDRTRSRMPSSA